MEVAIGTNGNTPFQREVREWQRIDPNTGALLSGRLEADRWINGPLNTYGKVVDSQNISQPNGTQQSQRKQLELYQARTSSGSMQVIRAQTVQTTSSRWSTSPSNTKISNSFDNNNQRNSINLKNAISTNVNSNSTGGNQITKTLTNGHNNNDDNNMKNIIVNNNHYQNSQNHKMLTAPSLKLSNLMKSSNNNCNGGGNNSLSVSEKNNLHCINSSMPLIQNHHHQHKKTEMQRKYDNNNEITTKPIPIKSLMLQHDNNCNRYEQHLLIHQQQQHQKQLPPTTLDLNRVGGVVVDFDYDDVKEHKNSMINKFTKEEKETDFYLQRGRSVSTDDLTTDWNENNNNADDAKNESSEWRRVSKIRRSFQLPKSSPSPPIKLNSTRPIDLPENSVSVSKIRQELENGRRLNTAMRNNNVDLAALDTILNGNSSTDIELSPTSLRKTAFLTSESLKEIRGKLKKLSDESLYKDDFLTNGGIVNMELNDNNHNKQTNNEDADKTSDIHTKTNHNSFENRSRYRDTSSAEWHLRRKSYGFEKMTPPDNKTMYRQETSTDSGIGRSSELGNWSPTESRGTIIAFGEQPKNSTTVVLNGINGDSGVNLPSKNLPIVQRRFRQNSEESSDTSEMKRHSIAVDETKYVRDNLRKVFDTKTSIHLNGFYSNDKNLVADEIGRQRKRVEFCKTEVHFAAESGRVNIVETDGKPPPTNNFRRRRRSSGNTYLDAITSGLQIMHFGDEKKATILEQESESLDDLTTLQNNVTVSVPIVNEMAKKDGITKNMLDEIEQDEISLRGILKNKPIKPKPYHLGENIDTKEKFWGVKLKPVTTAEENDQLFENGTSNICDLDKPDIAKTDFDRVKFVEERKNGTGYSTKINLSLTDAPFEWNSNSESIKSLKLSATNNIDKNIDILRNSSNHLINDNTKINEQCLKSTSLIMQQIRSNLNQFDDEEIHINATAIQKPIKSSSAIISNTTKLISNMSAITKSNSANSIFLEKQRRQIYTKPNYSSSLDGDVIINEPTFYTSNILKSNQNFTQNNSSYNMTQSRFMSVLSEEPQKEHEIKPIPAPRIKIIGSNRAPQIRRINDNSVGYGGFDSDDSAKADEEVKSYLSSENRRDLNIENEPKISTTAEMFGGSWSRIKAQRFVQKSKIILPEVPQSNIMSIELRSPDSSAKKLPTLNSQETKSSPQIPIAKPRTTVKSSLSPENTNLSNQKTLEINNSYQPQRYQTKTITNEFLPVVKEPLKIVTATNGARKLREHELSYFGVKVNTDDNHNMQRITNTELKNLKPRSINNHKNIEIIPNIVTSKWKLSNDKPDLLRHGPVDNITLPSVVINLNDQSPDRNVTEHIPIYENLQTSSKYNRNKDLDRDEKNLSEMAETADITLKAVTDRHKIQAQKYHQRIEMHSSTPLDTIDEKRSTRTFYDLESEEKLKPTSVLPVVASDSFQRKCCSRRSSSASSTGSISDSASINRSHSRSRSREKIDNNNIKKSSLSAVVVRPRTEHRSSSRDSQKSHNNSVENFKLSSPPQKVERKIKRTIITSHSTHHNDKPEPMPRHRREETKTIKSSSKRKESSSNQHGEKSSIDKSTSSGRKESKNRLGEKSSSSDRKESIQRHGERLATDRKESSSRHHRERSSNDIGDSSDRLKHSSRSSTSRVTTSDSHKQCTRSSKDFKDPSNIRSSQRSANNRTENSDSHQMKTRTDSHERHPSQERHKNSSSTRSSSGKPKLASSMDQKQRTAVRSSGGNTTNPTIVNSMTKTSSSRHHRSRKDHPRK